MKFANIDEAIVEAAKITAKRASTPPKKGATKKAPVKQSPPPAKKSATKKAPVKQSPPPAKKSATKASGKKRSAPPQPPETTPEKTPDEPKRLIPKAEPAKTPDEPKRLIPKAEPTPAPAAQKSEPTPPSERQKFAPRWLEPKRGIGDRLKDAWKSFKASAGQDLGKARQSYKSVFHEAQQLMKEYQMIESMLQEQAIYEELSGNQDRLDVAAPYGELTAADFAELRSRKDAIREVLAAQMVREELYMHRTTLAELNSNQRTALMETVKTRCDEMFRQLDEVAAVEETYIGDRYTLEQWMGMLEEAGYSLTEKFNPDEPILPYHSTSMPTGACRQCGAMPGQHCNCENDDDSNYWSDDEVERWEPDPRNEGGALEERSQENKEKKNALRMADRSAQQAKADWAEMYSDNFDSDGIPYGATDDMDQEEERRLRNKIRRAKEAGRVNFYFKQSGEDPTEVPSDVSLDRDRWDTAQGTPTSQSKLKAIRAMPKPKIPTPINEKRYSLEEWMGMLEEAGVNLDERNMANKAAKNAAIAKIGQQAAASGVFTNTHRVNRERPGDDEQAQIARNNLSMGRMAADKATAIKALKSATMQNIRKFNPPGSERWIESPHIPASSNTDFIGSDMDRLDAHDRTQWLARRRRADRRAGDEFELGTPGQKHRGDVPGADGFSGMMATRDGTLGSKADRDIRDKYGYGDGNKKLALRAGATKARIALDREMRGASLPGTVEFERDKERKRVGKRFRMESYTLEEWMGALQEAGYDTADIDEGKLGRLAAGLGLAGAAMFGGAKDAGAQQATPAQAPTAQVPHTSSDSVATGTARTQARALDIATQALKKKGIYPHPQSAGGYGRIQPRMNPDGTFTVTADYRADKPQTGAPQMEERYSLEEWMGMMEEAGYSLEEGNPVSKEKKRLAVMRTISGEEVPSHPEAQARIVGKGRDIQRRYTKDDPYKAPVDVRHDVYKDYEPSKGLEVDPYKLTTAMRNVGTRSLDRVPLPGTRVGDARLQQMRRAAYNEVPGSQGDPTRNFWTADRAVDWEKDLEEAYTLEEWLGMLEEAGHSDEISTLTKALEKAMSARGGQASTSAITQLAKQLRAARKSAKQGTQTGASKMDERYSLEEWLGMMEEAESEEEYDPNSFETSADHIEWPTTPQDDDDDDYDTVNYSNWDMPESYTLNENTVARLQGLAGIKPLY